ncbi:MAG: MGMT family protein [Chloroflexi bacterium]|nr:MGMT family protein [Chloroflexota bacterium]BCY17203.1 methyltransferase [Leptolinea sp. HRD-7]
MSGPLYETIYRLVRQVPPGRVITYGQVAKIVGGCSARMVGYAMAALQPGMDVPWQRVINAKGRISPHGFGYGSAMQRQLLEEEGIIFQPDNSIDMDAYSWLPANSFRREE